jgi:hypothetical protein
MSHNNKMNNTQRDTVPFLQHKIIIFLLGIIAGITWGYNVSSYFSLRDYIGGTPLQVNVVNLRVDSVKAESSANDDGKEDEKSDGEEETSSLPPSIENILDKVFILESSAGKRDSCHNQGKFNGFGLGHKCYESQEEVRNLVGIWFKEKLENYSLAESLCGYNLGFNSKNLQDCINQSSKYPYYQKYLII